jgi:actin-related protein
LAPGGVSQSGGNSNYQPSSDDGDFLLPLDVAIRKSIESCPTDDLKKKMFGCLLLVGGGIRFKGITKYLHQRLALQVKLKTFLNVIY